MHEINEIPLVSVIVLTYNQADTISRTLDSILMQETHFSYEIIIGEDASSDSTRRICEMYVQRHSHIHLMPISENKGLLRNYRDCLQSAVGKYIASCAGDDWWHNPQKIELQVEFLERNLDYGVCHTEADLFYTSSQLLKPLIRLRNCPEGFVQDVLYTNNFIYAASACFRRSLLTYADFDEFINKHFVAEDHAMWLAFSPYTKFHYLPVSTVTYSVNSESISNSSSLDRRLSFVRGIIKIQRYFLSINGSLLKERKILKFQNKWLIMENFRYSNFRYILKDDSIKFSFRHKILFKFICGCYVYYYFNVFSLKIRRFSSLLFTNCSSIDFV